MLPEHYPDTSEYASEEQTTSILYILNNKIYKPVYRFFKDNIYNEKNDNFELV